MEKVLEKAKKVVKNKWFWVAVGGAVLLLLLASGQC